MLAPPALGSWGPLTCILTAITTEMSSFSSSLNTTSFFKVRLHNLPRAKAQRGPHPPTPPGAPGRPHPRERWPPTWPPQEPLWGAGRSPACGAAPGRSVGRQAGSPQGPGARYGAPLPAPRAQASARAAPCPPPRRSPGSQPGPQLASPSPACAGSLETPAALRSPLCIRPPAAPMSLSPRGASMNPCAGVTTLSVGCRRGMRALPRGGLGLGPGPHVSVLGWGTAAAVPALQTGMQDCFATRGFMVPKAAEPPVQEPGEEEPRVCAGQMPQPNWLGPACSSWKPRSLSRSDVSPVLTGTAEPHPTHAASSPRVTQVPLGAAHPMPTCIQPARSVSTPGTGGQMLLWPLF